jgi:hypothetical protein
MFEQKTKLVFVVLAILLLMGGCRGHQFDWKQTLAITVETPSGSRTAAADQFIAAKYYNRPVFASTTTLEWEHRGDPVILDLGGGNVLFVIQSSLTALRVYQDLGSHLQVFQALTGNVPVEPRVMDHTDSSAMSALHLFRFKDLTDPSSIERVDPNDLGASFGPGVALTEITFSVRSAEIEPPIGRAPEFLSGRADAVLPWLAAHQTYLRLPRAGKPGLGFFPDDLRSGIVD